METNDDMKNSRRSFLKKLAMLGTSIIASDLFLGENKLFAAGGGSASGVSSCSSSYSCSGGSGSCGSSYSCSGQGAGGNGKCGSSYECSGGGGKCGSSYSCSGQGSRGNGKCGSS